MLTYRRSIYIGLGGTGIKTILKVKENFQRSCNGHIPSMIKFLCIDTNLSDLVGKDVDIIKLENTEKLHLTINQPLYAYKEGLGNGKYTWMPEENHDNITDFLGTGAGQVRSNGRFILEYNEEKSKCISRQLNKVHNDLTASVAGDNSFDVMATANIDIHVVSSIAGGTGSGIVIELAKIIKKIIPNSNVMGYFFSDSFFQSLPCTWNVKANAYATLFELNFEMSSSNRPFDTCVYIDNKTDSHNGMVEQYMYGLDEAINCTAKTMCVISSFGNSHWSFFDDVKAAMASGIYNQGQRMAWITSIGSSAISYNREELNDCLLHILALQFTRSLLDNISSPIQTYYLIEKIRESFYELEAACKEFVPPAWVVVDDNGIIIDECVQHDLKHYYCSKEDEICKWREDVRVAISNHILDLLKSNALNLHNIECILSELMKLFNELKYHNSEEQYQLCVEKRHMEHMLEEDLQALHRMLNSPLMRLTHRTGIIDLKNKICATKDVILKDEREIIRKDKIKEALSIIAG